MRILALDIGLTFGFSNGVAGEIPPRSGSIIVGQRGGDPHAAAAKFGAELRTQFFVFKNERPEMIVAEAPLHPSASYGGDALICQLLMHGALDDTAGAYAVPLRRVAIQSVRKHFIGAASVTPRTTGRQRTPKEREAARKAIKAAVLARAHLLGYFPRSISDTDRADACAVFDYAAAHYARAAPRSLHLFGESPASHSIEGQS